jgi:hypothetical protein
VVVQGSFCRNRAGNLTLKITVFFRETNIFAKTFAKTKIFISFFREKRKKFSRNFRKNTKTKIFVSTLNVMLKNNCIKNKAILLSMKSKNFYVFKIEKFSQKIDFNFRILFAKNFFSMRNCLYYCAVLLLILVCLISF